MVLDILTDPNPTLRKPTTDVDSFDMELQNTIDSMIETMRANKGVGLAAPQIGISKRIIVCEYEAEGDNDYPEFPLTIICNPKIESKSKEECKMVEGCLSFPGIEIIVKRPKDIVISGKDRYGNPIKFNAEKLQARVIQHEIEHLYSTLLLDHLEKLKVIFFGTGNFGLKTLELLDHDPQYIVGLVITTKSSGIIRGKTKDNNLIKEFAKKKKIPLTFVDDLESDNLVEKLKKIKPDIGIVCDFGKVIPKKVYDIPKYKTLNIHPSLLPKYRGSTPIQSAIIKGDRESGVTVIVIDDKIDHGPIVAQSEIKLRGNENFEILYNFLSESGATLLLNALPYYVAGDIKPIEQVEKKATFSKIISKNDGEVNEDSSEIEVERKVRAFYPWPGVYSINSGKRLLITAVHFDSEKKLIIDRVKPEGGKEMNYSDYILGHKTRLTFKK